MKQNIQIQIADPAGNITAFVRDPVPRSRYRRIAQEILADKKYAAEQVAFLTGPRSMEMSGLEFCGNATRSFALLRAKEEGITSPARLLIRTSGSDQPLPVDVDPEEETARIEMPLPRRIFPAVSTPLPEIEGEPIVDFGGIMHLVTDKIPPTEEAFGTIRRWMSRTFDPPALGVMFLDPDRKDPDALRLTPAVYVRDVDSIYWEGSCGSGTTAAAAALILRSREEELSVDLIQPAGTIHAGASKKNKKIRRLTIESPVRISEIIETEIEVE